MIILILAAGNQERWGDYWHPKQLVDIGGEPLLARIVRQCREREQEPVIVANDDRFHLSERQHKPHASRWTVETLHATRHLWTDRTIVLLGDVVYSAAAMNTIFSCRDSLRVFGRKKLRGRLVGRYYEIFALSFDRSVTQRMIETLYNAVTMAIGEEVWGKLRLFYNLWCKLPIEEYEHEDKIFCPIEDWTEDIDASEDYQQFVTMIVSQGKLDDACDI